MTTIPQTSWISLLDIVDPILEKILKCVLNTNDTIQSTQLTFKTVALTCKRFHDLLPNCYATHHINHTLDTIVLQNVVLQNVNTVSIDQFIDYKYLDIVHMLTTYCTYAIEYVLTGEPLKRFLMRMENGPFCSETKDPIIAMNASHNQWMFFELSGLVYRSRDPTILTMWLNHRCFPSSQSASSAVSSGINITTTPKLITITLDHVDRLEISTILDLLFDYCLNNLISTPLTMAVLQYPGFKLSEKLFEKALDYAMVNKKVSMINHLIKGKKSKDEVCDTSSTRHCSVKLIIAVMEKDYKTIKELGKHSEEQSIWIYDYAVRLALYQKNDYLVKVLLLSHPRLLLDMIYHLKTFRKRNQIVLEDILSEHEGGPKRKKKKTGYN